MASTTSPAGGISTVASGQVMKRDTVIIQDTRVQSKFDIFGPFSSTEDLGLRNWVSLPTNNLTKIMFHLFLFNQWNDGTNVWRARNDLEWRPVVRMGTSNFLPQDPNGAGQDANPGSGQLGVATFWWAPLSSPMIIPVGVPITWSTIVAGAESIAIEIRAPTEGEEDQGRDRLVISLSASQ